MVGESLILEILLVLLRILRNRDPNFLVLSVLVYSYSGLASLCSVYRRLNDPAGGPLPL